MKLKLFIISGGFLLVEYILSSFLPLFFPVGPILCPIHLLEDSIITCQLTLLYKIFWKSFYCQEILLINVKLQFGSKFSILLVFIRINWISQVFKEILLKSDHGLRWFIQW